MTGRNVVDSSGWLEYLADSEQAVHFEQALQDTENLIVPVITIYEVLNEWNQCNRFNIVTARCSRCCGRWRRSGGWILGRRSWV